jgi:hypothetical protein
MTTIAQDKQKAIKQLGKNGKHHFVLPDDAEVEAELRLYLALHQGKETPGRLHGLRATALAIMTRLQAFRPFLTGPVLTGTASEFSVIDIMLFADSDKEVEIFLLDQKIRFTSRPPYYGQSEALLILSLPETDVHLHVFPEQVARQRLYHRDGQEYTRLSLDKLRQWVLQAASTLNEAGHHTPAELG